MFRKLRLLFCLSLLVASCGKTDSESILDSFSQDSLMKVVRVPLPDNFHEFTENVFPNTVPLVISSNGTNSDQLGYWVLCPKGTEGEKEVLTALGLDYQKYEGNPKSALDSASSYNPARDDTARKAQQEKYCNSPIFDERVLCNLFKLAPEKQAPIICPGALDKIDGRYELTALKSPSNTYVRYSNGLAELKAINLGCQEIKQVLLPPGSEELTILTTQHPADSSELNCKTGTPLVGETFSSVCEAARAGRAEEDRITLNALVNRLGLQADLSCHTLKTKINAAINDSQAPKKSWDLSVTNIASLKLLTFFPLLEGLNLRGNRITDISQLTQLPNLKNLDVSENPEFGANDAISPVLKPLSSLYLLETLDFRKTKVSDVSDLSKLAFLKTDGIKGYWIFVRPPTCKTDSVSASLRQICEKLQKPILVQLNGNPKPEPRFVSKLSEMDFPLTASQEILYTISIITLTPSPANTCDITIEGHRIIGRSLPAQSCVIALDAKGAALIPSKFEMTVSRLDTCNGNEADSVWTETFPDRIVTYVCQRNNNAVAKTIQSGSCQSNLQDFVSNGPSGSCVTVRCPGPKTIGDRWMVDTADKLGIYGQECVNQNGVPTVVFLPKTGLCHSTMYEWSESNKSCVMVRCANGKALGERWNYEAPGLNNGVLEYACINGEILAQTKITCNSGYLLRDRQCQLSCGNDHAVTDSPWPQDNGLYVCSGSSPALSSCNSGYQNRQGVCRINCDSLHADGDAWSANYGRYACIAGNTVLSACEGGYASLDSKSCVRSCVDGHVEGQTWNTPARHGTIYNQCTGGAISSNPVCEPSFVWNGSTCLRDCNGHVEGSAWHESYSHGDWIKTCYESGVDGGVLHSCDIGYHSSGGSCVKDAPPSGGGGSSEDKCKTGAKKCDSKGFRLRCEAGEWVMTGSLCGSSQ